MSASLSAARRGRSATATPHVQPGDTCDRSQALAWLREDVAWAEAAVNRLVPVPLEQHQFDALVSFTFNLGQGALAQSTLLKLLNARRIAEVGPQFLRWNNGPNGPMPGLTRRRARREAMFEGIASTGRAADDRCRRDCRDAAGAAGFGPAPGCRGRSPASAYRRRRRTLWYRAAVPDAAGLRRHRGGRARGAAVNAAEGGRRRHDPHARAAARAHHQAIEEQANATQVALAKVPSNPSCAHTPAADAYDGSVRPGGRQPVLVQRDPPGPELTDCTEEPSMPEAFADEASRYAWSAVGDLRRPRSCRARLGQLKTWALNPPKDGKQKP